jgi:hypothetical protein
VAYLAIGLVRDLEHAFQMHRHGLPADAAVRRAADRRITRYGVLFSRFQFVLLPLRWDWLVDMPHQGRAWKARAGEREETVQARTVEITDLGADRVVADKAQTY